MDLLEARYKKNRKKSTEKNNLPLIFDNDNVLHKFKAIYDGFTITISNFEDMTKLSSMGVFGKGSLSRSKPGNTLNSTPILRERQFLYRKHIKDSNQKINKVLVVPDSDDEEGSETFLTNLSVQYQLTSCQNLETLQLTPEEAYFLMRLNCLDLKTSEGCVLTKEEAWDKFQTSDELFLQNYLVYHYFRSRNWILKPGLKFGGDFVLYKQDPNECHANYVIIIDNLDQNYSRLHEKNRRSMKTQCVLGLNRLCESAAKELLIVQVIWPAATETPIKFESLKEFSIKEVLLKRWLINEKN